MCMHLILKFSVYLHSENFSMRGNASVSVRKMQHMNDTSLESDVHVQLCLDSLPLVSYFCFMPMW